MKALLLIGTIVAALAVAGTAAAAPENGATVVNASGCVTSPFATVCLDVKAVEQTTTTPSGNVSYMWNGTSTTSYSFAFSSCSYSRSEPLHRHWLQKDDETQSRSEHFAQTVSFDCGGGFTQTCTTSYELHSANGAVQFQRGEFVCTTP